MNLISVEKKGVEVAKLFLQTSEKRVRALFALGITSIPALRRRPSKRHNQMRNLMLIGTTALALIAIPALAQQAVSSTEGARATRKVETNSMPIPATTTYVFDRTVGAGRVRKSGSGTAGLKTVTLVKSYYDGKLVKEATTVTVTKPPSNVVFSMGPAGYERVGRSGSYAPRKVMSMSSTAYISNEGAMNPTSNTATGRRCEIGRAHV